jgi:hypothetical protein
LNQSKNEGFQKVADAASPRIIHHLYNDVPEKNNQGARLKTVKKYHSERSGSVSERV